MLYKTGVSRWVDACPESADRVESDAFRRRQANVPEPATLSLAELAGDVFT